jgi:selenocysteine-specific elongation factor
MNQPVTIGTAGHIDHGKSALVRALTGIDPDRLVEEKRRGMTIDLGFAHLDLPSGRRVGIVDVPGHEALIHNMLAGAGGIDLVMLVVAADEGAMPQTREHLDILRFLRIAGGVVVVNKIDLVSDPDWLAVVEEDVRRLVVGTPLGGAPMVRVSARTGEGLRDLVQVLDDLTAAVPPRPHSGPVRLPVDRVFTVVGFGTVVTGTLWSGTIRPGDQLVVLPREREVRVRGVQVHGVAAPEARAGSRVAANLVGIEKEEVQRGDVLATPGAFRATDRLDVRLRLLPSAPILQHASRVHLHLGAGVTVARVALSDRTHLNPGDEAVAQVRLSEPVVALYGDRFVIRRYSPTQTIGGGVVLAVSPGRRRRGQAAAVVESAPRSGAEALVVAAVAATGSRGLQPEGVAAAAGVDAGSAAEAVAAARTAGLLVERGGRLFARSTVDDLRRRLQEALRAYHQRTPWRRGMPRDELKSRVVGGGSTDRLFDEILDDLLTEGLVVAHRGLLALAEFEPVLSDSDRRVREAIMTALVRGDISPPSMDDLRRLAPPDAVDRMVQALIDEGAVLAVTPELRFAASVVERVRRMVVEALRAGDEVTVATVRDRLGTSRKFALALMEFLDSTRVTRRVGDRRMLGPQADMAFEGLRCDAHVRDADRGRPGGEGDTHPA